MAHEQGSSGSGNGVQPHSADHVEQGGAAVAQPNDKPALQGADQTTAQAITLRSVCTGLGLVIALGLLIPWNDWTLQNTQLYNNYLPPVVTVCLVLFALAVNPFLGRFRYRRGELVVISVMLLALGGVVSGGMIRYLPSIMVGPANHLAAAPSLRTIREPLTDHELQRARQAALEATQRELESYDADQSGAVSLAEFPFTDVASVIDRDGDGTLSSAEVLDYRAAYDETVLADWRWPVPQGLTIGVPESGPVDRVDPEYQHVVDGYLNSLPRAGPGEPIRVSHRSQVTYRLDEGDGYGAAQQQTALSGPIRDEFRARGEAFLDLDNPSFGRALLRGQAGDVVALPGGGSVEIVAVTQPSIPWYAWWPVLATWSPLLIGAFVAMIAVAGAVRHQWLHNERLPYPIAAVTLELMNEPAVGRRFPALFYQRGFWVAAITTFCIIGWRGLYAYDYMPFNIPTEIDLRPALASPFLNIMPGGHWLARPTLWFSIVGMAYFMSLQVSFSLWFTLILANVVFAGLLTAGFPLERSHFHDTTVGGFAVMALVIVWMGRQHYWRMLRAAVGFHKDPAARAAAPYVWALLIGSATVVAGLVWQGATLSGAILLMVIFIGVLLVLSRIVAESGMPFCATGPTNRVDPILFACYGLGVPAGALIPLGLVGSALMADNRESLLPYVTNATAIGDRAGLEPKRLSLIMLLGVTVGCGVAFVAMVWAGYHGAGALIDFWVMFPVQRDTLDPIGRLAEAVQSPEAFLRVESIRHEQYAAYAVGAVVVVLFGWARMSWAWWPLHPVGFLMISGWCSLATWACMLVGWLWKALVLRYGGTGLYQRLKPVAIGLIAGEAVAALLFMIIGLVARAYGVELPEFRMLPR